MCHWSCRTLFALPNAARVRVTYFILAHPCSGQHGAPIVDEAHLQHGLVCAPYNVSWCVSLYGSRRDWYVLVFTNTEIVFELPDI